MANFKFLKAFNSDTRALFVLPGNKMLVERLEEEEVKTSGGLIIGTPARANSELKSHRPLVAVVVAVGEGYTDSSSDDPNAKLPLDVEPGSVVVLNPMGVEFFSTIPGFNVSTEMRLGITSESDVRMRFKDIETFEAYKKALGGTVG